MPVLMVVVLLLLLVARRSAVLTLTVLSLALPLTLLVLHQRHLLHGHARHDGGARSLGPTAPSSPEAARADVHLRRALAGLRHVWLGSPFHPLGFILATGLRN